MGYRESIVGSESCHPRTVDALSIDAPVTLPASLTVHDWTLV